MFVSEMERCACLCVYERGRVVRTHGVNFKMSAGDSSHRSRCHLVFLKYIHYLILIFGIVSYYVAITCFELTLLLQPSKLPCSA